jgi:hypothetical protein
MLVGLGAGAAIWSAAVIGIGAAIVSAPQTKGQEEHEAATNELVRVSDIEEGYRRTQQSSRAVQRARIEARFQVDRARCGTLGGFKRDKCLVSAHATRGHSMINSATS